MSKRRVNKQQQVRIEKIQRNFLKNLEESKDSLLQGLVLTRHGKHAEIEDSMGATILCSIRPHLETIVAGDRIIWQHEGNNQGVVVSLCPRTSVLARPINTGAQKPVAANINQIIIVVAPKPLISWPLLDSYLIMSEYLQLNPIILLNKTDLPCDTLKSELLEVYQPLGYTLYFMNKQEPKLLESLKSLLDNHVSVFTGQSGVGKSSIIGSILPNEQNISVNDISESSELGRHTTSNSRYYHLPSGGALIDSPGVREFSLWNVDAAVISQGYREFQPYLSLCKFRNCTHMNTPSCGLIEGINQGRISLNRYDNFKKLLEKFCN